MAALRKRCGGVVGTGSSKDVIQGTGVAHFCGCNMCSLNTLGPREIENCFLVNGRNGVTKEHQHRKLREIGVFFQGSRIGVVEIQQSQRCF